MLLWEILGWGARTSPLHLYTAQAQFMYTYFLNAPYNTLLTHSVSLSLHMTTLHESDMEFVCGRGSGLTELTMNYWGEKI